MQQNSDFNLFFVGRCLMNEWNLTRNKESIVLEKEDMK